MKCPCDSGKTFASCCEPYINGTAEPQTAEALMRSRYTAYTQVQIGYLKKTLAPESSSDFDSAAAKKWAEEVEWKGLKIESTERGGPEDRDGKVEFTATFVQDGETLEHHEVSTFKKNKQGAWRFVEGDAHTHREGEGHHHHVKQETVVREEPKVGRNDPCPCGSGKKYKKCCAA